MIAFVSILHALACVFIVIFILLQDPKGGVLGTLGGGGGSRSFFGAEGASPFLVSVTKWLAIFFACSSFYLSYMSSKRGSVMEDLSQSPPVSSAPSPENKTGEKSSAPDSGDNSKAAPSSSEGKAEPQRENKAGSESASSTDSSTPASMASPASHGSSKDKSQPQSSSENK